MKKIVVASVLTGFISGCASIPPDSNGIRVVVNPNPAPKSCKYLGQVVGNQGNFFTGGFTSNRNLEEGSMNDLKNKAGRLGANYIQLITTRAGITGSAGSSNSGFMSGGFQQTNITNLGNAYRCPPKLIGLD